MVSRKMRMLAASLAMVLCVSLYSVPKTKAVAVETAAVSIGAAVLSSYLIATNMDLIGDTAETISNGISSLADDFCEFISYSGSGEDWLSTLGNAATVSSPGMILLQGLYAREVGQFVDWLTDTFGLDEDGEEATAVNSYALYNGTLLPDISSFWTGDDPSYPFAFIMMNGAGTYVAYMSLYHNFHVDNGVVRFYGSQGVRMYGYPSDTTEGWYYVRSTTINSSTYWDDVTLVWSSFDILNSDGSVFLPASDIVVCGNLDIVRNSGFTNIANNAEDADELAIYTALPGVTLEELAADIPAQIAAGTLATTAELTQTGEGTDTETNPDTDEEVYPYFPVLNGIRDRLDNLGDSIVDGIMSGLKSLVVPDEAFFAEAVPALQETFQGRMGLLTFPISLLADFMGRLLDLSDQEPILRWDSVSIYGTQLIAAGQYNLNDSLASARVKQMHDIYMVVVNAILIFAFLGLCQNKYRKIMQN